MKYRHLQAHRHRHGRGQVHVLVHGPHPDPAFAEGIGDHWFALCKGPQKHGGHGIHGFIVPKDIPVTCLQCKRIFKALNT